MALFHYNCPPISSEDLGVFFSYVYAGYFVSNDKSIEIYYNEDVDQWEKVKTSSPKTKKPEAVISLQYNQLRFIGRENCKNG